MPRFALRLLLCMLLASVLLITPHAEAQEAGAQGDETQGEVLRVAVKPAEPFVIETEAGVGGISIELWRRVAEDLGIAYEFETTDLEGLLDGVADGTYAAGVAATTVTADREARMDFTHPFFTGGLAIAVRDEGGGLRVASMLTRLISPGFLTAIAGLAVLLAAVGMLVWLVERRANPDQFGGNPVKGLGNGFWFSAVTMTTVGYGDKAPISPLGRVVSLVWMFVSVIIISFFTGAIASAFTASQIEGLVAGPGDLPGATVGAIDGSAAATVLADRGVRARLFSTLEGGLEALEDDRLDAFVHDEPILLYRVGQRDTDDVRVLEATFERQPYAIALPSGSELREPINRTMLDVISSKDWPAIVSRYLDAN